MTRSLIVAAAAASSLSWPAAALAHVFGITGSTEQVQQIERSLSACPSLARTLDSLTKSTGFRQIRVTTSEETRTSGPFLAVVAGSEILVASDWLALQQQPFSDVRTAGDILPDNLCFDLGHLSFHVGHPDSPLTDPAKVKEWVDNRLQDEGHGFLVGWSYVVEAARAQIHGKPLNLRQAMPLLFNLRYRFAFLQAVDEKASPRLTIMADGTIPETASNVAAIAAVLAKSPIADLQ